MIIREPAWRVFSGELNASTHEIKGVEEKTPSYIISPLGATINRVIVSGVLLEKENVGSEEEPMWRARIQDVSGSFFISVGRFQPEAAATMASIDVPTFVTMIGKVRTYAADDGRVFVSIRPEKVIAVDEAARNRWIMSAAESMWSRLNILKEALAIQDVAADDLVAKGMGRQQADGIITAIDVYGFPESAKYLKMLQSALRMLLPDRNIDLGLPEDMSNSPDEIDIETVAANADKEDMVMDLLASLNTDGKGAPHTDLLRAAEEQGITETELEEITNSLMDKGLVYEPMLGRLKRID